MGEAQGVEAVLKLGDVGELVRHELDLLVDVPVLSDTSPAPRGDVSLSQCDANGERGRRRGGDCERDAQSWHVGPP